MSQNFVHSFKRTHGLLNVPEVKYRTRPPAWNCIVRQNAERRRGLLQAGSRGDFLMEEEVGLRRKWADKEKGGDSKGKID